MSQLCNSRRLIIVAGLLASFGIPGLAQSAALASSSGPDLDPGTPPTHPTARDGAPTAYDAATGNLVLFGGRVGRGQPVQGTWTWNGSTWTNQHPATSSSSHAPSLATELSEEMPRVGTIPPLPRITGREVVRALGKLGWMAVVQKGSHAQLKRPDGGGRVTVPLHAGETLGPGLLRSILNQAGITADELRAVL